MALEPTWVDYKPTSEEGWCAGCYGYAPVQAVYLTYSTGSSLIGHLWECDICGDPITATRPADE